MKVSKFDAKNLCLFARVYRSCAFGTIANSSTFIISGESKSEHRIQIESQSVEWKRVRERKRPNESIMYVHLHSAVKCVCAEISEIHSHILVGDGI